MHLQNRFIAFPVTDVFLGKFFPGSALRLLLELDCCYFPDIVTEDILVHKILLPRISSETNTLVAEEVLSNRIL